MSKRQIWITKTEQMQPIIDEALRTFPDAKSESQALTRALFHWLHNRQENSKRGAIDRVEMKLDKLIEVLEKLNNDATDRNTHP